jgi:hypothetical protein
MSVETKHNLSILVRGLELARVVIANQLSGIEGLKTNS